MSLAEILYEEERSAWISHLKDEIAELENLPPALLQDESMQDALGVLYGMLGELEKAWIQENRQSWKMRLSV